MTIPHLRSFAPLAEHYRGFVVDLWGVIHDGVTPYPGAIEALRNLRRADRRVVLLSNAPRRSAIATTALTRLGVTPDLYDRVVTSGEAAWTALGAFAGRRVYHLGPERDRSVLEDRPITLTSRPSEADLLVNTGPDTDFREPTVTEYTDELRRCLDADLPMICVNPDLEIVSGGRRLICAGALARWYETQGGAVRWIGKPYPEVYEFVWAGLDNIPRAEVLAVGDALRTDVAGARAVGIDACWILGGIHAEEEPAAATRAAKEAGHRPAAALPAFTW